MCIVCLILLYVVVTSPSLSRRNVVVVHKPFRRRVRVSAHIKAVRKLIRGRVGELSRPLEALRLHMLSHGQVETNSLRFAQLLHEEVRRQQGPSSLTSSRRYPYQSRLNYYRVTHLTPFKDALNVHLCRDIQSIVLEYMI